MSGDLITWLRAQLDEDEQSARWRLEDHNQFGPFELDPEQVLLEVDAKRRIIDRCMEAYRDQGIWGEDGQEQLAADTMKLLALPYADREGYRKDWRQ